MQNVSLYEQPLNEKVRNFLRLEILLNGFLQCMQQKTARDSRFALSHLLEVLEITLRSDVKNELSKELSRYASLLSSYQRQPHVDQNKLHIIQSKIDSTIRALNAYVGHPGQSLRSHEMVNSIWQRNSGITGPYCFDMPVYHRWLEQPIEHQLTDLKEWYATLSILHDAVRIYLKVLRDSIQLLPTIAQDGIYNASLNQDQPVKIIRVQLPKESPYYPEISGGKHRLSIRFMHVTNYGVRPRQTVENINFELACCFF